MSDKLHFRRYPDGVVFSKVAIDIDIEIVRYFSRGFVKLTGWNPLIEVKIAFDNYTRESVRHAIKRCYEAINILTKEGAE